LVGGAPFLDLNKKAISKREDPQNYHSRDPQTPSHSQRIFAISSQENFNAYRRKRFPRKKTLLQVDPAHSSQECGELVMKLRGGPETTKASPGNELIAAFFP